MAHSRKGVVRSPSLFYVFGRDGTLIRWNALFEQVTGYSHDEVAARKATDFFTGDDLATAMEAIAAVFNDGESSVEVALTRKDGERLPYLFTSVRERIGDDLCCVGIGIDVAARKAAEEKVARSEERLKEAQEIAHVGHWEYDLVSDTLFWSDEVYRILGFEPGQVVPTFEVFQSLLHPDDRDRVLAAFAAHVDQGAPYDVLHRCVRPSGEIRYIQERGRSVRDETGKALSSIGTAQDITELKQAQQQIEESERRYRTIFDTAGTGMISFGDDAVITFANEEWCKLSGYTIDETVGQLTWMPFFSEKSLAKMKKYHALRSKDPQGVPAAYEAEFVDRSGRIHEGIVNIQMVPGTQQRVASFQDLTELKRAQSEMYRADKMAALGQIIAGVAHEINNPNNFIYFNLPILRKYIEAIAPLLEQHLEKDPGLTILNMPYEVFREDVFKLLENMEHGSKRITAIVADLKSYVRGDEEKSWKSEHVEQAIERVMTLVGKQVRKMVRRFDVDIADGLPAVPMNVGRIEQVLVNLLINAGQAADKEQSWVKLTARLAGERERWVELRVEDNGAGIPEDKLEQIFEPFFTSKGREQGTGLGLSISQRIVEEHGGRLQVESKLGQGTCFTVLLPPAREG